MKDFERRKVAHLKLSLRPDVQASELGEWDRVRLHPCALPELSLADVSLAIEGTISMPTPFFFAGMTAGHPGANAVNVRLARSAAARGWLLGVGSQRRELEDVRSYSEGWAKLRKSAPGLRTIGNLGASQLAVAGPDGIRRLVEALEPVAFAIHLNALQEVIQPEGTPDFRGVLDFLAGWSKHFPRLPLVVKETGGGFSPKALARLRARAGRTVFAIDVSGAGGTHWGRLEGLRARAARDDRRESLATTFADWGVSTIRSIRNAAEIYGDSKGPEIWASGGMRDGLQAAKAFALGAHRAGFAAGALGTASKTLDRWMELREFELRTALFSLGYASVADLRKHARKERDVTHE